MTSERGQECRDSSDIYMLLYGIVFIKLKTAGHARSEQYVVLNNKPIRPVLHKLAKQELQQYMSLCFCYNMLSGRT